MISSCPHTHTCSSHRGGEGEVGWSLIELIVALALLGIVSAVMVAAVTGMFRSSAQTTSARKAQAVALQALDQVGADVQSAVSYSRDQNRVRDLNGMRKWALFNTPLRDRVGVLDLADFSVATATQIVFQTDAIRGVVDDENPVECVRVRAVASGASWRVLREVYRYSPRCNLTGAVLLKRSELTPPAPIATAPTGVAAGAAGAPLFTYELQYNSGWSTVSSGVKVAACTRRSVRGNEGDLPGHWINWITAVNMDLTTTVKRAEGAGDERLRRGASVRSRMSYDYLYALGCSA